MAIGFGLYLTFLGFQRALITDPLVALSSALPADDRSAAAAHALTTAVLGAVGASSLAIASAVLVGGDVGQAILIVAPWLPALAIQDFWRVILFRDGRGNAAALNGALWLLVMLIATPIAVSLDTVWAVIGCWAVGGVTAAALGFLQTSLRPGHVRRALEWWHAELWPLGRWFGASGVLYSIITYVTLFVLVALVGTSGVGGLRAVMTIFAPLTLVAAAIALPGLPALTRARAASAGGAMRLAATLSGASTAITATYVLLLALGSGTVLIAIFGGGFDDYADLIWPVAAGQVMSAAAVGFGLLLKAQRRGPAVLVSETSAALAALGLSSVLGVVYGLTGAAWGLAGGAAVGTATTCTLALRAPRRVSGHPRTIHRADGMGRFGTDLNRADSDPPLALPLGRSLG